MSFWNWIKENILDLPKKVEELEYALEQSKEQNKKQLTNISQLKIVIKSKELEINNLKDKKTEIVKPAYLQGKMIYKPKRRVVSKTKDVHVTFKKPQHTFDKSTYLTELLKDKGFIGCEKTLENAQKIHDYLASMVEYEHDLQDNWRPIADTLLAGFGDCDDVGGIVLTSAYGICGWKADEVFNACGKFENGGHSFCVVKIDGKWYISEGTVAKRKLKLWKDDSRYTCSWGVCNWKFNGMCYVNGEILDRIPDDGEINE